MRRIPLILLALVCGIVAAGTLAHPPVSQGQDATAPVFSSSLNPITFDFVPVGATSATKITTITNRGTATLKLSQVLLGGRDAKDFKVASDSCTGASLAPAATCTVGLSFAPSSSGTLVGWLRFTDNTPCFDWINIAGSGTDTAAPATARSATCGTTTSSTTTVTTTTGTPGTTPTPASPVSANSVVGFSKSCTSRRTVEVSLDAPKGKTFKTVKVLLHGKTIKTLKGKSIKTKVSLTGLPRGRFTVEVRATTTDGKRYVRKHYYVTCVASKS